MWLPPHPPGPEPAAAPRPFPGPPAELEVELGQRALLGAHRERQPAPLGLACGLRAVLLVHQRADRPGGCGLGGSEQSIEDDALGLAQAFAFLGSGGALDPEELRLKRRPVVEREDVQGAVVAWSHGGSPWLTSEAAAEGSSAAGATAPPPVS